MGAADWNWLCSSWIHLTMPVLLSASKRVSILQIRTSFCFGTIYPNWCVCSSLLFPWGTTFPDGKCLMKVMNMGKVWLYEKLFTCVCLLPWPRPPMLEGTLLRAFPFWISFFWVLLFLFHFQPSYISTEFKRLFSFCDSDYNNFYFSIISA